MAMNQIHHQTLVNRFQEVDQQLKKLSINLVEELVGRNKFSFSNIPKDEHAHFPSDDVMDVETGSQYFLHRHSSDKIDDSIHVHFFRRWVPAELGLPENKDIATHLIALELDISGNPLRWIVVNQWVVGDYWQPAEETINLFRDWGIKNPEKGRGDKINPICHEWLELYMKLNLDTKIKALLMERDVRLDALVDLNPDLNVLEDQSIEIFGCSDVD